MSRQLLIERAMQAVQARRATSVSQDAVGAKGSVSQRAREAITAPNAWLAKPLVSGEPSAIPQLLCLARWPDLRQAQVTDVVMVARVCGLLSYSPSAEHLIHRRLGVDREQLRPVLDWLRSEGCLRDSGAQSAELMEGTTASDDDEALALPPQATGGSIWQRLMRRLAG